MNTKNDDNEQLVKFRGVKISELEANILRDFESLANDKFKNFDEIEWNIPMGFSVQNNKITGLSIYEYDLKSIP
ncbi:MAG: hypothetical protein ACTSQS_18395, partial [Promethearchaeota archaeon]